jgi:Ca-activated chloride channel family protein
MKETGSKAYLKSKLMASTVLFWILCGFFAGALVGQILFQNRENDTIKLTMVYSSEKSAWISATQAGFIEYWNQKRIADPNLPQISLDFQPYGSGDMLIALLNSEIKPTIWSPASNIWVPLLNAKWQALTDSEEIIAPNYTRILYSPMVIATWENFYTLHQFKGFIDLQKIIIDNPNLVKLAHTDPRTSNSGFMATIMMVASFLQMDPTQMTVQNLSNPNLQQWMHGFEQAALFYGKSTGFLGKYMQDQGPNALQLTILYENLVQEYCEKALNKFGQKIIAVYPEEGTLFSDHPFCVLDAEWVTDKERMIANEYLNYLSLPENVKIGIQTGFRPIDTDLLLLPEIQSVYQKSFNWDKGVTPDPSVIKELIAPTDGNVIARIPDLWLLTRNKVD